MDDLDYPRTAPGGTWVDVIKLRHDGVEATRYRAVVIDEVIPAPWMAVRAEWVFRRVESHGLVFEPGDSLVEYFSPEHPYDCFRVEGPDGAVRGWYANVTYPTTIRTEPEPTIIWQDLYLDVIKLANGRVLLCDEDELAESGLRTADSALHEQIVATAAELVRLAEESRFPFHTP
ncbi:MAG: DUF402 domain-containing protein [Chloroflexota bacterium]|nr:DUF402 domain-containing protein [Chloroflexota bacterium]